MTQHLPVLLVVVPLLAAPLCVLIRSRVISRVLAIAASWISLWMATELLGQVLSTGPISYHLGSWEPPYGI